MPIRMRIRVIISSLFITIAMQTAYAVEGYDFSALIRPVPAHARLEHEDWFTWGASVLQGEDGRYHMFYCRWPKQYPFSDGWVIIKSKK